jgi:hypothetical protein
MRVVEQKRKKKVEWLKDAISLFFSKKPTGKISRDKLVAEFSLENNSTERTGKEILKILATTGLIKIEGDEITNGNKQ